jgi:glycosyltransferase involved in cell wall biosynthesis
MDTRGDFSIMKKVVVKGPALSASGYGEQARFALRSLKDREDIDLFLINIPWGKTGQAILSSEEKEFFNFLIEKTQQHAQQSGGKLHFDMSVQITIPNEFEKMADVNIGYTAGIETTKVSPQWLDKSNQMDKLIVPSNHSKNVFEQTIYKAQNQQTGEQVDFGLRVPVEVCAFPAKVGEHVIPELELSTEFNFLSVAQWGPRKNLVPTIVNFVKEFKDDEDVGLVLKLNLVKNSIMDKEITRKKTQQTIKAVQKEVGDFKCKVYLLHGSLTDEEMRGLYRHPKIKAFVTTTHGEGFGLPMFEAAIAELPIIAPAWSSYVDFLYAPKKDKKTGKTKNRAHFIKIDFELKPVEKEAVWDGVIQADSQWCWVKDHSVRDSMREARKNHTVHLSAAKKLSSHILENFSEEKQKGLFAKAIHRKKALEPEEITGISFCIATNGAKVQKTNLEIKSIRNTMSKVSVPYEIIISGDVSSFEKSDDIVLVDTAQDAHDGLLAKLRNNAGEKVKYDTIVFVDDDFIFSTEWASRLLEFSEKNGWEVLANKILLPDGGRFWDRSTLSPHRLVDYNYPENSANLYQTGGFWIMRKEVYNAHKWDGEIPINGAEKGLSRFNEDVEMFMRIY